MNIEDLKAEFRISNDGDNWGNCMQWLFTIADELEFNHNGAPEGWCYTPSPLGESNEPEDYLTQIVKDCDEDTLIEFGNILNRLSSILETRGESY